MAGDTRREPKLKVKSITVTEHDYRGLVAVILIASYVALLMLGKVAEAAAVGPWVGLIVERYFRTRRKRRRKS